MQRYEVNSKLGCTDNANDLCTLRDMKQKAHWNLSTNNINNHLRTVKLFQEKMHATLKSTSCIISRLCKIFHNTHDHDRNIKLGSCWDGIFAYFTPQKFSYETLSESEIERTVVWLLVMAQCLQICFNQKHSQENPFSTNSQTGTDSSSLSLLWRQGARNLYQTSLQEFSLPRIKKLTWKLILLIILIKFRTFFFIAQFSKFLILQKILFLFNNINRESNFEFFSFF